MWKFETRLLIILTVFVFLISGISSNITIASDSTQNLNRESQSKYYENIPVQKPTKGELNYYNIFVDYNPLIHSVSGWINVSFLNKEISPISNLVLNLWGNGIEENSITIHNVLNNTGSDLSYNVDSTKLIVTTPPIQNSQRYNISIYFTTTLPLESNGSRYGFTNGTYSYHAFGNWHPILAVRENGVWNLNPLAYSGESFYSEMAYFDIKIRTDSLDKIAAAADLQEVITEGNNLTYHYTSGPVRDFAWVASPSYLIYSEIYKGVNISSFYFPGNARGVLAVDVTKKSLILFSDLFEPWPYETMNIAELDPTWFGGMEYNQLIMINHVFYNSYSFERFEEVISHEWAHSWNTYIIANNPYIDPWLDESWAMYATSLYYEEYGQKVYEEGRQDLLKGLYFDFITEYPDSPLGSGMDYWDFNPGGGKIVYDKGCVIISMLRYVMGDDAFFEAIVDFYDTFSYKTVTAFDFINLFNSHVDDNISWFFDQFVYDTDILDYEITNASVFKNEVTNNYELEVKIKNNYENEPNVMKVPLVIELQNGDSFNYDIMIDETQEVILIDIPMTASEPKSVFLDPDWILLRQPGTISKAFIIDSIASSSSSFSESSEQTVPNTNISLFLSIIALVSLIIYRRKKI